MSLIYIDQVATNRSAFEQKVIAICTQLGIKPDWLMATMWVESELDEKAVNPQSDATGLIQFHPINWIELGTTKAQLLSMTNVEQLDLVYKYLYPYRRKIKSFIDCYFAVFFPAAIGQYSDYVLQSYGLSAAAVAHENGGYDINKDNELTFREVESKILLLVDPAYRQILRSDKVPAAAIVWTLDRIVLVVLAAVLILVGGYKLLKSIS